MREFSLVKALNELRTAFDALRLPVEGVRLSVPADDWLVLAGAVVDETSLTVISPDDFRSGEFKLMGFTIAMNAEPV